MEKTYLKGTSSDLKIISKARNRSCEVSLRCWLRNLKEQYVEEMKEIVIRGERSSLTDFFFFMPKQTK